MIITNQYHIIEGKLVHLSQAIEGNDIKFYVDGKFQGTAKRGKKGNLIEDTVKFEK